MVIYKLAASKFVSNILWAIGFILITTISLFITAEFFTVLTGPLFVNKYLAFSISLLLFMFSYVVVCGVLFRLFVPKMKEGRYVSGSKQHILWRMNWHFYSYIFLFARYLFLYLPFMRYLVLKLFRVNLTPSVYIAETANFQDCNNLITIGENSGIGSEVMLSTHLALSPTISVQRKLTIGSNTHIQARVCLAPGVTIGNNTIIGFASMLSLGAKIGNDVKIGANVVVGTNCIIGNNCRIGHCVIISESIKIADNTTIPDYSKVIKLKGSSVKETVIDSTNINRYINLT